MIEYLQSLLASYFGNQLLASTMSYIHFDLNTFPSRGISPTSWIFDSGSSHHMTPNLYSLNNYLFPNSPIPTVTTNVHPYMLSLLVLFFLLHYLYLMSFMSHSYLSVCCLLVKFLTMDLLFCSLSSARIV